MRSSIYYYIRHMIPFIIINVINEIRLVNIMKTVIFTIIRFVFLQISESTVNTNETTFSVG